MADALNAFYDTSENFEFCEFSRMGTSNFSVYVADSPHCCRLTADKWILIHDFVVWLLLMTKTKGSGVNCVSVCECVCVCVCWTAVVGCKQCAF